MQEVINLQTVDISQLITQFFGLIRHWLGEIMSFLNHVIILPHLSALEFLLIIMIVGILLDIFIVVIPVVIDND